MVQQRASCSWIEVHSDAAEVTEPRRLRIGDRAECGTAGGYVIRRATYALELWTGNSPGAELFVRAVRADGGRVELRSPQLVAVSAYESRHMDERIREYSHTLDGNVVQRLRAGAATDLTVTIYGPDGAELGVETLRFVKRNGYYVYRDGL